MLRGRKRGRREAMSLENHVATKPDVSTAWAAPSSAGSSCRPMEDGDAPRGDSYHEPRFSIDMAVDA